MTSNPGAALLQPQYTPAARVRPIKPASAGKVINNFAAELLGGVERSVNAVVSPLSVYSVLAMAAAGAAGATSEQLAALLGADRADPAAVLTTVEQAITDAVVHGAPRGGDPHYNDARPLAVRTADALFVDRRFGIRDEFLRKIAAGFGAGLYQVDYGSEPDAARRAINDWVSDRTDGLITELLRAGDITDQTVLTLVNAIRLTAPWMNPFHRAVQDSPFVTATGSTVRVRLMRNTGYYRHGAGENWSWVTVPYRGGRLTMTLIVPTAGGFDDVRSEIGAVLGEVAVPANRSGAMVVLSMPSFQIRTRLSLRDQLRTAGVRDLFDPAEVDLSEIAGAPGDLVAGEVIHQAVIAVDEQGTEAAAATAMSMMATGAPSTPVPIVIDRSFVFVVHDTATGAALFLGQVIDPTA